MLMWKVLDGIFFNDMNIANIVKQAPCFWKKVYIHDHNYVKNRKVERNLKISWMLQRWSIGVFIILFVALSLKTVSEICVDLFKYLCYVSGSKVCNKHLVF